MPYQKRRKLTSREQRLVQGVARGKSKAQAARDAGYAESTALKQASTILNRPLVRSVLTEALEEAGATMRKVVQPVVDALEANVRVLKVVPDPEGDGKKKCLIEIEAPDHKTRLEAHDRAVALYGGVPKVGEGTPTTGGLTIFIDTVQVGPAGSSGSQPTKVVDPRGAQQGVFLDVKGYRSHGKGRG